MQVLALHNLEDVASLLTDITLITEVDVSSVPNIEKFRQYLNRYKFDAVYILDDFFKDAVEVLLTIPKFPKAILIFLQKEEDISKFLRLGLAETNIETIPFNPLGLFVKTKALLMAMKNIEIALKEGVKEFNYYRIGLFNLLNHLTGTDKNLFVSVRDVEENKTLYSLRIRGGQVVSCSEELEKVVEINLDDSLPKVISLEPVAHEDRYIFRNTAEFYKGLLEIKEETPEVVVKEELPPIKEVIFEKENLLRERRIYKFPYKGYTVYTQPPSQINQLEPNALIVCSELTESRTFVLRTLLKRFPNLKIVAPEVVRAKLKLYRFSEKNFETPEGVKTFDFPFLGSKFEGAVFFPNGILITGNLFGSFVSKNAPYLDRIFFSHFRIFHFANISSNERLKGALEKLERVIETTAFIFPAYGYAIDSTLVKGSWEVLNNLSIPNEYAPLSVEWKRIAEAYSINAESYEEFTKFLKEKDSGILFDILDDMEVLGIVPFEF